ncbi:hypothetical protein COY27_01880 [Candidatus Woesearchaeota archaeon CG_4_10_14_0_2_um_filter_33_13]|nr:MAG: hypothetical protein COY27_01880 [Candidatus Woesearchaeota archaeon CG_4_10_14_0_2_um_filter_33_13]
MVLKVAFSMKLLVTPKQGPWVAVQDQFTREEVKRRILQTDVCLTDFDDTDAFSPAKVIAYTAFGTHHLNGKYLQWAFATAVDLLRRDSTVEERRWGEYKEAFLATRDTREELYHYFSNFLRAQKLVYPGVEEFYSSLPNSKKFYVTRNLPEIVIPFAALLGFDGFFAECYDKPALVDKFVADNPHFQDFLVKGDSGKELELADRLRFYRRSGTINSVTTIGVADSPLQISPGFDVVIGKDYHGLVSLLR